MTMFAGSLPLPLFTSFAFPSQQQQQPLLIQKQMKQNGDDWTISEALAAQALVLLSPTPTPFSSVEEDSMKTTRKETITTPKPKHVCPFCNSTFANAFSKFRHLKNHSCSSSARHIALKKKKTKQFTCSKCGAIKETKRAMLGHTCPTSF
jgi:predicted RNA-binding Zn-ribbon protein involved in translation (DUF1610 family)